jgi:hypothetical protein
MARRAVIALALFPTSFFLWMYYSEALLISATAAAVWAGRREKHNLAAVLLAIAATARVVGVTVGPALALARIVRLRRVDSVCVRYILGSLAGLAAVMTRQAVEIGDPLGWLSAGRAWGRQFAGPWSPLLQAWDYVVGGIPRQVAGALLETTAVVVVGVLVALAWRGYRLNRWPVEPAIVATVLWAVPLFSSLIFSQVRYQLACWPVCLVVADLWPRLPRVVRGGLLGVAVVVSAVLLRRLAAGLFVG